MEVLSVPNSPKSILREYFGYDSFREHQEAVIEHLLSGGDAFVLMPTGSGKSLCYQIPGMIREGTGVVISPLIALMQDQVDALRQIGVRADFLNSSLSAGDMRRTEQRVVSGDTDLLYVAPERLMTGGFRRLLDQTRVALFAVDEAHCVSQWGHDFRPEYLQIALFLTHFPEVPRVALTATADSLTRREIPEKLRLRKARDFVSSFDRPNICYRVKLRQNGRKQLWEFLRAEHPGNSGIVYCRTQKNTEKTAKWLSEKGYTALPYHAGMPQYSRLSHHRRFLDEEGVIIVATVAFGMGIDKPDVRFIAHFDMPRNMEAYYQETGRAGRDGQPADAWMLYSLADVVALRRMLDNSDGDGIFKRIQAEKTEAMLGFCESAHCRRQTLLNYFGEDLPQPCGNCDICQGGVETWDGTVAAQKALSCVYRTGQRFGSLYLCDVLLGKHSDRILKFGHDRISTFGIGSELSEKEWRSVFRQLVAAGLLRADPESRGGFLLSPRSRPVLRGEQRICFRKDPAPSKRKPGFRPAGAAKNESADPESAELWEKLRGLRLKIARENNVPPYVVFHDSTLKEMLRSFPRSPDEMRQIYGIGRLKLELYGEVFLELLREHGESRDMAEKEVLGTAQPQTSSPPNADSVSFGDLSDTVPETVEFFRKGMTPKEIARERNLKMTTVYTHFSKAIEERELSVEEVISLDREEIIEIENAFRSLPDDQKEALKPVFEKLQEKYDYGILRCIRAGLFLRNEESGDTKMSDHEKSYRIQDVRKAFPKAYEKWTDDDDEQLREKYSDGKNVRELADMLGRKPGAVLSRLKKLEIMRDNTEDNKSMIPPQENFFRKKIVCLANSRKYSRYCVAGKEISESGISKWIRPVSNPENRELSINDIILQHKKIPKLLDIITVSLKNHLPFSYQTENYITDKSRLWVKNSELPVSHLPGLCDDTNFLWINGYHSYNGFNDRIPANMAERCLTSSLLFIRPENIYVIVAEGAYGKKIRARFTFRGVKYWLAITDPIAETQYLEEDVGEYPLDSDEVYFTVSISEPYNNYCYKLVAGVVRG